MRVLRRAFEPTADTEGTRVLVDRLWPRGITQVEAHIDVWAKGLAPSTQLRKWFGHAPKKWADFQKSYRAELKGNEGLPDMRALCRKGTATLVCGAKDEQHTHALVLKAVLQRARRA